ncbi:MAG: hypothetical protein ABEN55_21110 [Bradymonadaceae bacterium]
MKDRYVVVFEHDSGTDVWPYSSIELARKKMRELKQEHYPEAEPLEEDDGHFFVSGVGEHITITRLNTSEEEQAEADIESELGRIDETIDDLEDVREELEAVLEDGDWKDVLEAIDQLEYIAGKLDGHAMYLADDVGARLENFTD